MTNKASRRVVKDRARANARVRRLAGSSPPNLSLVDEFRGVIEGNRSRFLTVCTLLGKSLGVVVSEAILLGLDRMEDELFGHPMSFPPEEDL